LIGWETKPKIRPPFENPSLENRKKGGETEISIYDEKKKKGILTRILVSGLRGSKQEDNFRENSRRATKGGRKKSGTANFSYFLATAQSRTIQITETPGGGYGTLEGEKK